MDVIEFTTWPKHQLLFYKITSGGLLFSMKSRYGGAIGLSHKPDKKSDYWIFIERSTVKLNTCRNSFPGKSIELLSHENFVDLWITWKNDKITLGRGDEAIAVWSNLQNLQELQYVTFSTINKPARVHVGFECSWKCYLPSTIENLPLKKFKDGLVQWVSADEQLPDGALIGGHEKEFLYIMRAKHRGSLTPGKFVPSLGLGFLPWGGGSQGKSEFDILVGYNCHWVKTYDNKIPVGAIEGGYSEDRHEILYIGRANHNGHVIPGKVQPSHNTCYIPYEDKEISHKEFEILVENNGEHRDTRYYYKKSNSLHHDAPSSPDFAEDDEDYEEDDEEVDHFGQVLRLL